MSLSLYLQKKEIFLRSGGWAMTKKDKKRGFSLMELLVVISLIGILSAVAVLNMGGQKDTVIKNHLKVYANEFFSELKIYSAFNSEISTNLKKDKLILSCYEAQDPRFACNDECTSEDSDDCDDFKIGGTGDAKKACLIVGEQSGGKYQIGVQVDISGNLPASSKELFYSKSGTKLTCNSDGIVEGGKTKEEKSWAPSN